MESSYIKACLSAYFRFSKQHHFIATEVGRFNADFLSYKKGILTEVEIKVSKADLNNDFKKQKHQIYEQNASPWTPHYFYFCVPPEMLDYAIAKCVDKPYGVMVIKDQPNLMFKERVRVVKRAKKLNNNIPSRKIINYIVARLASEMSNLRIEFAKNKDK